MDFNDRHHKTRNVRRNCCWHFLKHAHIHENLSLLPNIITGNEGICLLIENHIITRLSIKVKVKSFRCNTSGLLQLSYILFHFHGNSSLQFCLTHKIIEKQIPCEYFYIYSNYSWEYFLTCVYDSCKCLFYRWLKFPPSGRLGRRFVISHWVYVYCI